MRITERLILQKTLSDIAKLALEQDVLHLIPYHTAEFSMCNPQLLRFLRSYSRYISICDIIHPFSAIIVIKCFSCAVHIKVFAGLDTHSAKHQIDFLKKFNAVTLANPFLEEKRIGLVTARAVTLFIKQSIFMILYFSLSYK